MSILIKGMELPEDKEIFLRIDEKGEVYVYGSYPTELHKAVPVPPHGDLIDRDALVEEQKLSRDYHAQNSREESLLERAIRIVREAPVVVPAERSDTDA